MHRKPRKVPFSSPRRAPYRRKYRTQPSEPPRPTRAGTIDQKLIEGAQVLRHLGQFRRDEPESSHPEPEPESAPRRDDDMELDAFGECPPN